MPENTVIVPMHGVLAKALESAQAKFGKDQVYVADEHSKHVYGFKCPLAWSWFVGGSSIVPTRRVIGCDGASGSFKSCLMMEHARWLLRDGGIVILIDTEEKVSDTMICGLLFQESIAARCNYVLAKAKSVEQAQDYITHFRKAAGAAAEKIPWLIIWDSLTGKDTADAQAKIQKEGHAATKAFADAANSIARFYKGLTFGDDLITLAHVQHVGNNMDQDAYGDDKIKAKGGDEPRYASTYHFRVRGVSNISSAQWAGKELTLKCIKSGLGEDKRQLRTRVLWKYCYIDQPLFNEDGVEVLATDMPMTWTEAQQYFDWTQQCLPGRRAVALQTFLKLGGTPPADDKKGEPHCVWPLTERLRFQQTWWDWDFALGNLLVHGIKYDDKTYAQDKQHLDEALYFVKGTTNNSVKCEELFGDSEVRTLEEFGAAIEAHPEIRERVRVFLGITNYKNVSDLHPQLQDTKAAKPKAKRGKKTEAQTDG